MESTIIWKEEMIRVDGFLNIRNVFWWCGVCCSFSSSLSPLFTFYTAAVRDDGLFRNPNCDSTPPLYRSDTVDSSFLYITPGPPYIIQPVVSFLHRCRSLIPSPWSAFHYSLSLSLDLACRLHVFSRHASSSSSSSLPRRHLFGNTSVSVYSSPISSPFTRHPHPIPLGRTAMFVPDRPTTTIDDSGRNRMDFLDDLKEEFFAERNTPSPPPPNIPSYYPPLPSFLCCCFRMWVFVWLVSFSFFYDLSLFSALGPISRS